jgi:Xaa-Pro dipeptidase
MSSSSQEAVSDRVGSWEGPAFERAEYARRIAGVRAEMERMELDALVVTAPDNMYYLTGYDSAGYYQFQAAVLERGSDEPWLVVHEVEAGVAALSAWVTDLVLWSHGASSDESVGGPGDPVGALTERLAPALGRGARVGVEKSGSYLSVSAHERLTSELGGGELVDTTRLVPGLRAIKSPAEIECLRAAAALSDAGVTAAYAAARIGGSELDVLAAVQQTMTARGSEYSCMPAQILSGPRTVAVHQSATARTIENGDPMTVEIAGVVRRYNSNILRSFLPAGSSPNDEFREAYELVVQSYEAALALAGPGVPGAELDRASRRVTERFGRYRLHRTGYGVEAGYPPAWVGSISLAEGDPTILQPGMVVSIEPTLIFYDRLPERRFSALFGNNVLIVEDGFEVLNRVPAELG